MGSKGSVDEEGRPLATDGDRTWELMEDGD